MINDKYLGWGLWKDGRFAEGIIADSKRSLLIGYGLVSLSSLEAIEESLFARGCEALRTRVRRLDRSHKNTDCAWTLAHKGEVIPGFLGWTSIARDKEEAWDKAVSYLAFKQTDLNFDFTEDEKSTLCHLQIFPTEPGNHKVAKRAREQKDLDRLLTDAQGVLARHGFAIVPVLLEPMETSNRIPRFTCPEGWKIKKRFKVNLWDMVDGYWNSWTMLETYAYIARSTFKPASSRESGPFELMSVSSCVNSSSIAPLAGDWITELRHRWRHILLHRVHGEAKRWKEENGIKLENDRFMVNYPTAERIVPLRFRLPNGKRALSHAEQVTQLLGDRGWLAWSLNDCWQYATRIHGVNLHVGPNGAVVSLTYGLDHDSSSWHHRLAYQKPNEPLIFLIQRAQERLDRLKDPDADPPVIGGKAANPSREARARYHEWNPSQWISEWNSSREFFRNTDFTDRMAAINRIDDC